MPMPIPKSTFGSGKGDVEVDGEEETGGLLLVVVDDVIGTVAEVFVVVIDNIVDDEVVA